MPRRNTDAVVFNSMVINLCNSIKRKAPMLKL
jgi:hypothetical protein